MPIDLPNALELLEHGSFGKLELIPWGSNYTFVTTLSGSNGAQAMAVYKPRRGEVPLRDFPNGTLYKREVAAYELARLLDWDMVPPTIVRQDAPHGIGSLQWYVQPETGPAGHYDALRTRQRAQLQRIAAFDLLTNNADRKGGHCLLDEEGHLWGIDHGLTFHHVPKLRTIIWDYCGEPLPADLLSCLQLVRTDPRRVAEVKSTLKPYISATEMDALFARWDALLASPCFPNPDPYRRSVPWPPF